MPELPEVETTVRAVRPVLEGQKIGSLVVRRRDLRWPVPSSLPSAVEGQVVDRVWRRAKYLLAEMATGTLIVHLGMSGSIRILKSGALAPGPHDHIDMLMQDGVCLRYTDPRRFGAWLWTDQPVQTHVLLRDLGPEPWEPFLTGAFLRERAGGRSVPVKSFIMDNHVLVGVGNIYATEALFRAGIHPARHAGKIAEARWDALLAAIRDVLESAIRSGGSTLRDFSSGDGRPGYFAQRLQAYGRAGLPCVICGAALRDTRLGGRASAYCPTCQR